MKLSKTLLFAAILVLLGVVLVVTALAMTDFDLQNLSVSGFEERSYETSARLTEIEIDIKNVPVRVEPSRDSSIHLAYYESDRVSYTINELDNGKLRVTSTDKTKWYDHYFNIVNVDFFYNVFTVTIPESYEGEIRIKTSNGSINIEDLRLKDLKLTSSNGSITAEKLAVDGEINLNTSNSKIRVSDVSAGGDIICETSNSPVSIKRAAAENISVKTSSGSIDINGVAASRELNLKTSNGKISFERVNVGSALVCKTSNSSVEGVIDGKITDYTISAETSNASSTLPSHMRGGDKILDIKTSNGSISVSFTD